VLSKPKELIMDNAMDTVMDTDTTGTRVAIMVDTEETPGGETSHNRIGGII